MNRVRNALFACLVTALFTFGGLASPVSSQPLPIPGDDVCQQIQNQTALALATCGVLRDHVEGDDLPPPPQPDSEGPGLEPLPPIPPPWLQDPTEAVGPDHPDGPPQTASAGPEEKICQMIYDALYNDTGIMCVDPSTLHVSCCWNSLHLGIRLNLIEKCKSLLNTIKTSLEDEELCEKGIGDGDSNRTRRPPYVPESIRGTTPFSDSQVKDPCGCGGKQSDHVTGTVNLHNGEFVYQTNVYSVNPAFGPPLDINATYRSRSTYAHAPTATEFTQGNGLDDVGGTYDPRVHGWKDSGSFGRGWDLNWARNAILLENGDVAYYTGDGRVDTYLYNPSHEIDPSLLEYVPPPGYYTRLEVADDKSFIRITERHGTVHVFKPIPGFNVDSVSPRSEDFTPYRLSYVEDTLGQRVTVAYQGNGAIKNITDAQGGVVEFRLGYGSSRLIQSITHEAVQKFYQELKFKKVEDGETITWWETHLMATAYSVGQRMRFLYHGDANGAGDASLSGIRVYTGAKSYKEYTYAPDKPPTHAVESIFEDAWEAGASWKSAFDAPIWIGSFLVYEPPLTSDTTNSFRYGSYNATARLLDVLDGQGRVYLRTTYDPQARVLKQQNGQTTTDYEYPVPQLVTHVRDGNGNLEKWEFESQLRPVPVAHYEYLNRGVREGLFEIRGPEQMVANLTCSTECEDPDEDKIANQDDNCPNHHNPSQADSDGDGFGDACSDGDGDGWSDAEDNCPSTSNWGQDDMDGNGIGDACDDRDADAVPDEWDNCTETHNPEQRDQDGDGTGDECDHSDGDGILDAHDNCPNESNPSQADADGDGVGDECDNCPSTVNPDQADKDNDGTGDVCDSDPDGDGSGGSDNCPGTYNPSQTDSDGDGRGDACDNCPSAYNPGQADSDGDGKGNSCDNCTWVPNPGQADVDGDGLGNACDNCPSTYNPSQADSDHDQIGDACEVVGDDDQDGVGDADDNCYNTPNPDQNDRDGDGLGDACDSDRDGDWIGNGSDNCPDKANQGQTDANGNGVGDACEDPPSGGGGGGSSGCGVYESVGTDDVSVSFGTSAPCLGVAPPGIPDAEFEGYVYITKYDHNYHLEEVMRELPRGNRIVHAYDEGNPEPRSQGNLLAETRERGSASTPTGVETMESTSTTYTYEPRFNHVKTVTEGRGNDPDHMPQNGGTNTPSRYTTTLYYDYEEAALGDLNGDGNTSQEAGNVVGLEHPLVHAAGAPNPGISGYGMQSAHKTWTYNGRGQLIEAEDEEAVRTRYVYHVETQPWDKATSLTGNMVRRIDDVAGKNAKTNYTIDMLGSLVAVTDPEGAETKIRQSGDCLVTKITLPESNGFVEIDYTKDREPEHLIQKDKDGYTIKESWETRDVRGYVAQVSVNRTLVLHSSLTTPDWMNITTKHYYDGNGNRIATLLPTHVHGENESAVRTFMYDERDLLYYSTTGGTTWQWNAMHNTTYAIDLPVGGRNVTEDVDANGNVARRIDSRGDVTAYGYDGMDRLVAEVDPLGSWTESYHDATDNVVLRKVYGPRISVEPDEEADRLDGLLGQDEFAGVLTSLRAEPEARSETVLYSAQRFLFDERGRSFGQESLFFDLTNQTLLDDGPLTPDDGWVSEIHGVDKAGRLRTVLHDDGGVTFTHFNGRGQKEQVFDAVGNHQFHTYDKRGNLNKTVESFVGGDVDRTFNTTFYTNTLGQRIKEMAPPGNTSMAYDGAGNLRLSAGYRPGLVQQFDSNGNLRMERHGGITTLRYTYDLEDRIASREDGTGKVTNYTYNVYGELVNETFADGSSTSFVRDEAGNAVSTTDARGVMVNRTYDALNRVLTVESTGPADVVQVNQSFVYDAVGNVVLAQDNTTGASYWTAKRFDSLGNVVWESQNDHEVRRVHDGMGGLTSLTYPDRYTVHYDRDLLGRVTGVWDEWYTIAEMSYEGPAWEVRRELANGVVSRNAYNNESLLERRWHEGPAGLEFMGDSFGYDGKSRLQSVNRSHLPTSGQVFEVDNLDRLTAYERGTLDGGNTSVTVPDPDFLADENWTLDAAHNWLQRKWENRSHSDVHETTHSSIWGSLGYDGAGNLVSTNTYNYTWDALNRLRRVHDAGTGDLVAEYGYDTMNRRVASLRPGAGPLGTNLSVETVWDGWREAMDVDGVIQTRYVNGDGLDDRLFMEHVLAGPSDVVNATVDALNPSDPVASMEALVDLVLTGPGTVPLIGQRFWYVTDQQGSVQALTGPAGIVLEAYVYTPYGDHWVVHGTGGGAVLDWSLIATDADAASDYGNPFTYTGRRYDEESGLHYYRTRYYWDELGRFVSRDTIGMWGDMAEYGNAYSYVGSAAHVGRDPMGESVADRAKQARDSSKEETESEPWVQRADGWICGGSDGHCISEEKARQMHLPYKPYVEDGFDADKCFDDYFNGLGATAAGIGADKLVPGAGHALTEGSVAQDTSAPGVMCGTIGPAITVAVAAVLLVGAHPLVWLAAGLLGFALLLNYMLGGADGPPPEAPRESPGSPSHEDRSECLDNPDPCDPGPMTWAAGPYRRSPE